MLQPIEEQTYRVDKNSRSARSMVVSSNEVIDLTIDIEILTMEAFYEKYFKI